MSKQEEPRILIPITHPLGGIKTYNLALIRSLSGSGFSFTVLAPAGKAFDVFREEAGDVPDIAFLPVPNGKSMKNMILAIRRAIRKENFAALHSQGLRAAFETAVANWGIRTPHLATLHGVVVPQEDVSGKAKWLKKRFIGYATRYIDTIVTVSDDCLENHLEQFPEWKKGPCRLETVHNGVDLDRLDRATQANKPTSGPTIRERYGLSSEMTLVGFFGRFMPEKGFLFLLEGLRILASRGYEDKIRLVATRDEDGYLEYIRAIESDATLSKMVIQIKPQSNIAPLMKQMNLVIMPSLWESSSLVAMESMVLGIPFIGSTCIGVREVIRETPCPAVVAGDAVSIADEIEKAIQNPWTDEAEAFVPTACERFDFNRCTARIRKIYDRLCAKSTGYF